MSLGLDRIRLVVRDERADTRRRTAAALDDAGFKRIWVIASDDELFQLAGEVQPHALVLVDHTRRGAAFDAVCEIRAGRAGAPRELPVVMVEDRPTDAFLAAAERCGVTEVVPSPPTAEALLAAVNAALSAGASAGRIAS
ncbi:MAG: hypothetical protein PVI23_09710 [Maricaulaceae bacterium]|jgi:DNA-binding response OmpR family regulator